MSSSAELAVLLTAQDRGATGTVERFRSTLGGIPNVAGGITSAIGKVGSAFATFGLATQGVQTLAGAVTSFFGDALEAQQVAAQTAQTLSTMGSASGQTAESIADMAGKLSRLSLFQDDAIQGAENLLLTFGNVGKDAFPRATQAILDLSQAMGQDLNTSATQIGKALNDPIAGVSALSRVGIQFSEDQKNMIASLMETGDVAGAQNIILGELERQFGGSAKAASDAAGPLGQVGKRFGEIKEAAGTALLPLIQFVAGGLVPVFEWLEEKIPVAIAKLISIFGGPFKAIWVTVRDAVLTFVQALQGNWTDDAKIRPIHRIMGQIATVIREQVIPAVKTIAAFFQERLVPIIQSFATTFNRVFAALADGDWLGALDAIVDGVRERFGLMGDIAKDLGSAFLDWIAPLIPPLLEKLGELASAVAGWVVDEGLPRLLEQLSAWGSAFVAWIEPLIPPMLEKLQELLGIIGAWIVDTGLPLLLEKLGEWGAAFVEWVTPYIDLALEKLGELLNRVRDWILGEGLDTLTASIEEWAAAFVDWVTPQIDLLIEKAEELAKQLGEWITGEGLKTLTAKLAEWAKAAIEWVVPVWVELELKMLELLGKLGEWIVMTALPAIVTQLAQWTYEFHRWVLEDAAPALIADLGALWSDHISPWITGTALPAIIEALKGWANAFLDWLKDSVVPFIVEKLEALLSSMKTWMTDTALPAIKEKLKDWATAFLGWVADVVTDLPGKMDGILTEIGTWVTNNAEAVAGKAGAMASDFVNGFATWVYNNASAIISAVIGWIKDQIPSWSDIANSLLPGNPLSGRSAESAPGTGPTPLPHPGAPPGMAPGTGPGPKPAPTAPTPPEIGDPITNDYVNPLTGTGNLSGGSSLGSVGRGGSKGAAMTQQQADTVAQMVAAGVPADQAVAAVARTPGDISSQATSGAKAFPAENWSGGYAFDSMHDYRKVEGGVNGLDAFIPIRSDGLDIGRLEISGLLMSKVNGRRHMWDKRARRSPVGC